MRLGGLAFRQVNLAPLGDKILGGHTRADYAASLSGAIAVSSNASLAHTRAIYLSTVSRWLGRARADFQTKPIVSREPR